LLPRNLVFHCRLRFFSFSWEVVWQVWIKPRLYHYSIDLLYLLFLLNLAQVVVLANCTQSLYPVIEYSLILIENLNFWGAVYWQGPYLHVAYRTASRRFFRAANSIFGKIGIKRDAYLLPINSCFNRYFLCSSTTIIMAGKQLESKKQHLTHWTLYTNTLYKICIQIFCILCIKMDSIFIKLYLFYTYFPSRRFYTYFPSQSIFQVFYTYFPSQRALPYSFMPILHPLSTSLKSAWSAVANFFVKISNLIKLIWITCLICKLIL